LERTRFIFFTLLVLPVSLFSFDFGLITNQYAEYSSEGDENHFRYQADILPRFSFLIGSTGEFFLSAGFTIGFEDELYYVPELLRTEISLRFGGSVIKAGRMNYSDPLAFVASGLFDGVQFTHFSKAGGFSIGAWYTGLLYKKTANITMTVKDQAIYDGALDYGDFLNTYFAPPRVLASVDWEHPSVGELLRLKTSVIGQFDLTKEDDKYHSLYLVLKAGLPFKSFLIELGGSLEATLSEANDETQVSMAYACNLGLFWTLPTSFSSRLSLTGTYAAGRTDDFLRAFVPVTTKFYGNILQAKLSGLTVIDLNYTARISSVLGTSLTASYFIRNDLGTFNSYPAVGAVNNAIRDGYFLGAEFFANLIWSPVSDLQLNLGGGAFLPSLGNVSDEKARWRIELTAIVALY